MNIAASSCVGVLNWVTIRYRYHHPHNLTYLEEKLISLSPSSARPRNKGVEDDPDGDGRAWPDQGGVGHHAELVWCGGPHLDQHGEPHQALHQDSGSGLSCRVTFKHNPVRRGTAEHGGVEREYLK